MKFVRLVLYCFFFYNQVDRCHVQNNYSLRQSLGSAAEKIEFLIENKNIFPRRKTHSHASFCSLSFFYSSWRTGRAMLTFIQVGTLFCPFSASGVKKPLQRRRKAVYVHTAGRNAVKTVFNLNLKMAS